MNKIVDTTVWCKHQYYIKDEDGNTIAMAAIDANDEEYTLTDVWVDSDHRHNGYAHRVIGMALADYWEKDITLFIFPQKGSGNSDYDLIKFYSEFGFKVLHQYPYIIMKREGVAHVA